MSDRILRLRVTRLQAQAQPSDDEDTAMDNGNGPMAPVQPPPDSSSESSDEDEDDNEPRPSTNAGQAASAAASPPLPPLITFPPVALGKAAHQLYAQQPFAHPDEDTYDCRACEGAQGNVASMFDHYNKHHNGLLSLRLHKEYAGRYIRECMKQKLKNKLLMRKLRKLKASTERRADAEQESKLRWACCYACMGFRTKKFHDLDSHFLEEHARERFDVVKAVLKEE